MKIEEGKIAEKDDNFHGYQPWYDGFEGNNHNNGEWRDAYKRVIPERFEGDERDSFTAKMIKDFAEEGKDKDTHTPNGHFFINKDKARAASYEVLETHLGLKGGDAENYLNKYFDETFSHMDVLNKGNLDAIEMNKFMR